MAQAGGAFGGARGLQPKPPEKGVFPLDHFGECKEVKERYMKCLAQNNSDAEACRELAKEYLQCRMERNLMAPADLKDLGFVDGSQAASHQARQKEMQAAAAAKVAAAKEKASKLDRPQEAREGFVAGTLRFRKPSPPPE